MQDKKPGFLRRLGRGIGRTLRFLVASVRALVALAFVLVLIGLFAGGLTPLPSSAVLRVAPAGALVEQLSYPDLRDLLSPEELAAFRAFQRRDIADLDSGGI
jgi:hypothetical protein